MLWAAQFTGPRGRRPAVGAGDLDEVGPGRLWLVLAPRARLWGLVWLAVSVVLSLVTLPLTIIQLQALFGFGAAADPPRLPRLPLGARAVVLSGVTTRLLAFRPSNWRRDGQRVARLGRSAVASEVRVGRRNRGNGLCRRSPATSSRRRSSTGRSRIAPTHEQGDPEHERGPRPEPPAVRTTDEVHQRPADGHGEHARRRGGDVRQAHVPARSRPSG